MNEDLGLWHSLFFIIFGSLLIQLFPGRRMVGRKGEGSNNQSSGGPQVWEGNTSKNRHSTSVKYIQ